MFSKLSKQVTSIGKLITTKNHAITLRLQTRHFHSAYAIAQKKQSQPVGVNLQFLSENQILSKFLQYQSNRKFQMIDNSVYPFQLIQNVKLGELQTTTRSGSSPKSKVPDNNDDKTNIPKESVQNVSRVSEDNESCQDPAEETNQIATPLDQPSHSSPETQSSTVIIQEQTNFEELIFNLIDNQSKTISENRTMNAILNFTIATWKEVGNDIYMMPQRMMSSKVLYPLIYYACKYSKGRDVVHDLIEITESANEARIIRFEIDRRIKNSVDSPSETIQKKQRDIDIVNYELMSCETTDQLSETIDNMTEFTTIPSITTWCLLFEKLQSKECKSQLIQEMVKRRIPTSAIQKQIVNWQLKLNDGDSVMVLRWLRDQKLAIMPAVFKFLVGLNNHILLDTILKLNFDAKVDGSKELHRIAELTLEKRNQDQVKKAETNTQEDKADETKKSDLPALPLLQSMSNGEIDGFFSKNFRPFQKDTNYTPQQKIEFLRTLFTPTHSETPTPKNISEKSVKAAIAWLLAYQQFTLVLMILQTRIGRRITNLDSELLYCLVRFTLTCSNRNKPHAVSIWELLVKRLNGKPVRSDYSTWLAISKFNGFNNSKIDTSKQSQTIINQRLILTEKLMKLKIYTKETLEFIVNTKLSAGESPYTVASYLASNELQRSFVNRSNPRFKPMTNRLISLDPLFIQLINHSLQMDLPVGKSSADRDNGYIMATRILNEHLDSFPHELIGSFVDYFEKVELPHKRAAFLRLCSGAYDVAQYLNGNSEVYDDGVSITNDEWISLKNEIVSEIHYFSYESVFDHLVRVENTVDDSSYFESVLARGKSKNSYSKQQRKCSKLNYETPFKVDEFYSKMDTINHGTAITDEFDSLISQFFNQYSMIPASQYDRIISKTIKSIDPNICSESSLVELSICIARNKPKLTSSVAAKSNLSWKLNKRLFLKVVKSRLGKQIDSDKALLRSLLNGTLYSLLHVSPQSSQSSNTQLLIHQPPLTAATINNIIETLAFFEHSSIEPDLSTWAFILYIFGGGPGNGSKLQKRLIEMMVSKRLNTLVVKDIALSIL
ncbi:unnamed protein product [Ambrosiozyma monospora]|uniref:Unnamed protein product n=1 Tax=Ambrosiozyma monospora TaxID=43982 RepID=A0A9W7DJL7_AMBMO|nr:unnamed protein product [Ambrosiozyma monospora]